jgi:hypothetical protein
MDRPSVAQAGDSMPTRGSRVTARALRPSVEAIQTLSEPVSSLMKTSCVPSGESRGCD